MAVVSAASASGIGAAGGGGSETNSTGGFATIRFTTRFLAIAGRGFRLPVSFAAIFFLAAAGGSDFADFFFPTAGLAAFAED